MSPTTVQILGEKALDQECGQSCVDWAVGLLETGSDSDALAVLAGMTPPFNHFEVAGRRDRALAELGIADVSKNQAVREWAGEHLRRAWNEPAYCRSALSFVSDLCIRNDYQQDLFDFYLLDCAWDDLDEVGVAYHWLEATRDSIAAVVRARIESFLSDRVF
ncbi:MAG TPA: hypothetical protein VMF13_12560 [Luteitalea sp.]|nr:hypothetical protein [Luteitalea sp.]